jgi:O-antigen/teichoic acid export membrane protein
MFVALRGFSILIATLAANGLPNLLVRFLPVYESKRQRSRAIRLSSASLAAAAILIALLGMIVHRLHPFFFSFLDPAVAVGDLLFWFYAATFATALKLVLYGGLNGLRRLPIQVVLEICSLLAVLVWIVLARDGLDIVILFRILGTVNILTLLAGLPFFFAVVHRSTAPEVSGARGDEGAMITKQDYRGYLFWSIGLSLVALAFTDVDRYLLSQVIALEAVSLFHISARVTRLANRLIGIPNLALQPELSRLDSEGRRERAEYATKLFLKMNTIIAVLLTLLIISFAREIVLVIASDQYLGAVPVMILLALSLPLSTITAPITTVMKGLDQIREALLSDLAWAAGYVTLLIVLGRRFGLIGVGLAQIAACLLQLLVASRLSRMAFPGGFVFGLFGKLAAGGVTAFMPVLAVGILLGGLEMHLLLPLKILLVAAGCLVYPRFLASLGVFSAEEKEAFDSISTHRSLRLVGKWIGVTARP